VELKENSHLDQNDISVTSAVPSSSSLSTVSAAEVNNAVDNTVELLKTNPGSLRCLDMPSASLDVESSRSSEADHSSSASAADKVAGGCPIQRLPFSKSSTDLSHCSEEFSINRESLFDNQKCPDILFRNSRNTSSSSLMEMSDNKHKKTNLSRKRKHDNEMPECGRLMLDKLPNYYTALSIPSRVLAGSAARSSSDLIKDFMRNERDPSPERKSCSVYDKLPAYHSSFTNSTRYDDREHASVPAFETDFYHDETETEVRYCRSFNENYELHDFKLTDELLAEGSCSDDDSEKEEETSTENVSYSVLMAFTGVGVPCGSRSCK